MKNRRTIPTTQNLVSLISCGTHDYIEIACMYRYDLTLELRSGEIVDARAVTTVTQKNEFGLTIESLIVESKTTILTIPLNEIINIETKSKFARFQSVNLASHDEYDNL